MTAKKQVETAVVAAEMAIVAKVFCCASVAFVQLSWKYGSYRAENEEESVWFPRRYVLHQ